jgi:CheY-specific phosphatase CheX
MPPSKPATLATIFSEVLADLAFLFTDEAPDAVEPDDEWIETAIGYRGPVNGDLTFRCPRRFTHLLAANLLGADAAAGVTPSQADDAVKEFMNIVCGQFVTANHGVEEVFNLTIPAVRVLREAPDFDLPDDDHVSTLYAENCRLQLLCYPVD